MEIPTVSAAGLPHILGAFGEPAFDLGLGRGPVVLESPEMREMDLTWNYGRMDLTVSLDLTWNYDMIMDLIGFDGG